MPKSKKQVAAKAVGQKTRQHPDPDFEWQIRNRANSQKLLLRLHRIVSNPKKRKALESNASARSVFGSLVGTGFSLWRAAFLADAGRTWPNILDDADYALKKLLEENAFSFQNERWGRSWMAGYYLNGAKYRVAAARKKLGKIIPRERLSKISALNEFDDLSKKDVVEKPPKDVWNTTYKAALSILKLIDATGGSKRSR